jgi:hypothetical protein
VLRVTDVRQSDTPTPTTETLVFQPRASEFDIATNKLKKYSLLDIGAFPAEVVKSGSNIIHNKEVNKLINSI